MREVRCLHELFEVQAALHPTKVAVTCGQDSVTYAALEVRANQLASHLRRLGLRPGGLVAIYMERSVHEIVAMLACLKAGGGYVPIDPVYPLERVRFVLDSAGVSVVLTEQALADRAAHAGLVLPGTTVLVDRDRDRAAIAAEPGTRLPADAGASERDLCYVIYTSGTTGRPKGVMTEHRSVVHFVAAFNEACRITDHDRIFQGFSASFDGSVAEIWLALAHGASLVIGTADVVRIGAAVARVLNQHRVTVFSTVPTMLSTIDAELPSVRLLIVSGERCSPALVNHWTRPGRRLLHVYGPTEATVKTTVAACVPGRPVTIGRPLRGYHVRVLDEAERPVKDGVSGELYIGGVGLARGYLGQPALSAQRFVPSTGEDAAACPRLYRTGDLVRWTASGELDFVGRIDGQVKLRGFRVIAPRTEAEQQLAAVWQEVLQISPISIDDDFFTDLGGHSRLAAQLVSLVRKELDLDVAVRDVYRWPTIRELAAQATAAGEPAGDARPSSQAGFDSVPRAVRTAVPVLQAVSQYLIDGIAVAPLVAIVAIGLASYHGTMAVGWLVLLSAALFLGAYPVLLLFSVAVKWLVIGRYKPGRYRL